MNPPALNKASSAAIKPVAPSSDRLSRSSSVLPPPPPPERLNARFLGKLLLVAVLVGGAWYGLHTWQNRRTADALLEAATQARAEGPQKAETAARFYSAYLQRRPDDAEARIQLAELLTEQAQSVGQRRQIVPLYAAVLAQHPERNDLRRRLVKLAIAAGMYDDAAEHLTILRKAAPEDVELLEQQGDCEDALGKPQEASDLYQRCVKLRPDRLEAYLKLAKLWLNRLGSERDADRWLDRMVEANPKAVRAWLERAYFRKNQSQPVGAEQDVAEALALEPHNRRALYLGAQLASARADGQAKARAYLRTFIEQYPKMAEGYEALARLELQASQFEEALRVLRQGLKQLPEDPGLLWNVAYLLVQTGEMSDAQEAVERSVAFPIDAAHTTFIQTAVQVRQGQWRAAREVLDALRPQLVDIPELSVQLDLLTGRCLERLADPSAAVLVYRRAVRAEPLNASARLGVVSGLLQQGRVEAALIECRQLIKLPRVPVLSWILYTRLLMAENYRRLPAQRQWEAIDEALRHAEAATPKSDELVVLRAEVLLARGDAAGARKVLEEGKNHNPRKAIYRTALAQLAQHERRWSDAENILREAIAELGDKVDLRVAQAWLEAGRGRGAKLGKALAELEKGTQRWPQPDRVWLLEELGQIYYQNGLRSQARDCWRRLAALVPTDLAVRLSLFDVAYDAGDEEGMREALEAIRSVEGFAGALGRYNRARLLIHAGRKGDTQSLEVARSLLVEVAQDRPEWSRVPLAMAQVDELEGRQDSAIDNYQRAVDMGEKQLSVMRRLVELLYERRRYAHADLVLRKLPEQTPVYGNLQRLAAQVKLEVGDAPEALDYARRVVPADSKDPADQRWLGAVLEAAGQRKPAEAAFRQAVALAPAQADNWIALVQFLARTGRKAQAEATLAEARAKLPAKGAELALAQAYAAIDRPEVARQLYQGALRAHPDDAVALRTAAEFYLQVKDLDEAQKCLRSLLAASEKDPATARQARTLLAVVLAATGDHHRTREALQLLGLDQPEPTLPADLTSFELRARAVVLATQSAHRYFRQAIRILQQLGKRQELSAEDRFLMAQLAERLDDRQLLRENLDKALDAEGTNPRYAAYKVRVLLRQGSPHEASLWVEKVLEANYPQSLTTVELRARVLQADGQTQEAAKLLRERAAKNPAERLALAGLMEELDLGAAAEELYRAYAAEKPDPERRLLLARCLGRQGRLEEALRICSEARTHAPAETVGYAMLAVLHGGHPSAEQMAEVKQWLDAALRQSPRSAGLLVCQADLADLRGQFDEAVALYRQVLAWEPRNAEALNNLAWLLALQKDHGEEALRCAEEAVDVAGPLSETLDSRGLAHLSCGRVEEALQDFREAWRPTLSGRLLGSIRFHQAWALEKMGKRQEAQKALQQAREAGMDESSVHPLERAAWSGLVATLK